LITKSCSEPGIAAWPTGPDGGGTSGWAGGGVVAAGGVVGKVGFGREAQAVTEMAAVAISARRRALRVWRLVSM
jgi:hypothetical protein